MADTGRQVVIRFLTTRSVDDAHVQSLVRAPVEQV
jgi:hypothetical protein